jgi:hypothetical protein
MNSFLESTGWREKFGLAARFLYNALLSIMSSPARISP